MKVEQFCSSIKCLYYLIILYFIFFILFYYFIINYKLLIIFNIFIIDLFKFIFLPSFFDKNDIAFRGNFWSYQFEFFGSYCKRNQTIQFRTSFCDFLKNWIKIDHFFLQF